MSLSCSPANSLSRSGTSCEFDPGPVVPTINSCCAPFSSWKVLYGRSGRIENIAPSAPDEPGHSKLAHVKAHRRHLHELRGGDRRIGGEDGETVGLRDIE